MKRDNCDRRKKILILSLQGIGNTLLSFPMIRSLRNHFPESCIDVIVANQGSYELLKLNQNINKIIPIDITWKKILRAIHQVRKNRHDIAITTFPPGYRNDFIMFFVRAKTKIGFPDARPMGKFFAHGYTYKIKPSLENHDKDENLKMIQYLGISPDYSSQPNLETSGVDDEYATNYLNNNKISDNDLLICVQPGTSNGVSYKRWPPGNFVRLADILTVRFNAKVMLFGGKDNEKLLSDIALLIREKPLIVCGEKLAKVCAIIKRCSLFISNDSGLMHVAAALGIPVVALFGVTDPKRTGPCGINHKIIKSDIACSPCYTLKTSDFLCPKRTNACMKNISVERVVKAVEQDLRDRTRNGVADF